MRSYSVSAARSAAWFRPVLAAIATLLSVASVVDAGPKLHILVAKDAPTLEKFAADELAGQWKKLFDADVTIAASAPAEAGPLILLGDPSKNPELKSIGADWPKLSDQGHLLRSIDFKGRPALVVGGGSPVATLWAAYELGRRFGVRSFLFGDIYPEQPPELKLDKFDVVLEPRVRLRGWQALDDSLTGSETWSADEHRRVLGQLAKLKFNHVVFALAPWQPFIGGEGAGPALLLRGATFPVDGETAGRGAFGGARRFENPDFAGKSTRTELLAAGKAYLTALVDAAQKLGMSAELQIDPLLFPPEVARSLQEPQSPAALEGLAVRPGSEQSPTDPRLRAAVDARLRRLVADFPRIDSLHLHLPVDALDWSEQGRGAVERAAQGAKRGDKAALALGRLAEKQPDAAQLRGAYVEAALLEFLQATIQSKALARPEGKPALAVGGEFRALSRLPSFEGVIPTGIVRLAAGPYSPGLGAMRLDEAPRSPAKSRIQRILTIDSALPSNGVLPELSVVKLESILQGMGPVGFEGLVLADQQVGDADLAAYYLARAAFEEGLTMREACIELLTPVCGEGPTDAVWKGFKAIEQATSLLRMISTSFDVPAPEMLLSLLNPPGEGKPALPDPVWEKARDQYLAAMNEMYRANQRSMATGRAYTLYFARRYEFAYEYFNVLESLAQAGQARRDGNVDEERSKLDAAVTSIHAALSALAAVARSSSDRAVIAVLNEYGYRPIKRELERVEAEAGN